MSQSHLRLSTGILLVVTMLLLANIASPVNGLSGSGSATFTPAGPSIDKLLMSVFISANSEYLALQSGGQIDIPDSPVLPGMASTIASSSSLVITPSTRTLKVYGLEFNQNGNFWGCNLAQGTSPCGVELRRGIAHLIGKDGFIANTLQGLGEKADCFSSPLQGLPCSESMANGNVSPWNVCSWDPMQPTCTSAFYLSSSTNLQTFA